jgi:hypothetical protein
LLREVRISILLWVSDSNGNVRASWHKVSQALFSWSSHRERLLYAVLIFE